MLGVTRSEPFPLFRTKHYLIVSGKSGVYRIRFFKPEGVPFPIPRLAGVGDNGVLRVGKFGNLSHRIRQFRQAAEGLKASHAVIESLGVKRDQGSKLPLHELLPGVLTEAEREALKLEKALHDEYRLTFLDRPPLDSTSGQEADRPRADPPVP